jgi:hypothetical protein
MFWELDLFLSSFKGKETPTLLGPFRESKPSFNLKELR